MNFDMNSTKIFEYKLSPADNINDEDINPLGFLVQLYSVNRPFLIYRIFDFEGIIIKEEKYHISRQTLSRIVSVLRNSRELWDVPETLDNGSCDGCINEFFFADGRHTTNVWSLNIAYRNPQKDKVSHPQYWKEYEQNIYYENTVCQVFRKITQYLRQDGIFLSFNKFKVSRLLRFLLRYR